MSSEGRVERTEILPLMGKVKRKGKWTMGLCPSHGDGEKHRKNPLEGASLGLSDEGVLQCFAGCAFKDVMAALRKGGPPRDDGPREHPREKRGEPSAVYEYRRPDGELLAIKRRYDMGDGEKRFTWQLPNGSEKDGLGQTLADMDMPLWGAEIVAKADRDRRVWVVEGEKACQAIRARQEIVVTGGWGASQSEFGTAFDVLAGRKVILWPDNDAPGRQYMERVRNHLIRRGITKSVITVDAPVPQKGDAVDYFNSGGTLEDLLSGALSEPAVDHLEYGSIRVRVPTNPGIAVFTFDDPSRASRSLEAELTVDWGLANESGEPYILRINTLSQSARESLVRQLGKQFPGDVNWTKVVNTAWAEFRDAYHAASGAEAEEVAGDATLSGPEFILQPYVMEEAGSALFALPGKGKSTMAMMMAVSIDAGESTLWPVRRRKVLWVNLERSRNHFSRRLARINRVVGLPSDRPLLSINRRGSTLADTLDSIRAAIRKHNVGLVVLDSISRAGTGSLVSDEITNRNMDMLNSLEIAWLAIGHSPRDDADHIYGSIMQDAACDMMVQLKSEHSDDGSTLGVAMKVVKNTEGPTGHVEMRALEMDAGGVAEVRDAKKHEFPDLGETTSKAKRLKDWMVLNAPASGAEAAKATGLDPSWVSRAFNSEDYEFVRKEGRQRLYAVAAGREPDSIAMQSSRNNGEDGTIVAKQSPYATTIMDSGASTPSRLTCSQCSRAVVEGEEYVNPDGGAPLCVSCWSDVVESA